MKNSIQINQVLDKMKTQILYLIIIILIFIPLVSSQNYSIGLSENSLAEFACLATASSGTTVTPTRIHIYSFKAAQELPH